MNFGLEMGQMGAITGDCFVKVAWELKTDEEGNPIDEEYPEVRYTSVIPSSYVFRSTTATTKTT